MRLWSAHREGEDTPSLATLLDRKEDAGRSLRPPVKLAVPKRSIRWIVK